MQIKKAIPQSKPVIEQVPCINKKRIENFYILYPFFLTSADLIKDDKENF